MFPNVVIFGICLVLFCRASEWSLCHEECCYFRSKTKVTWQDGHDLCKEMGSDYASIHSEKENAYVFNTVCKGGRCWVGLTDAKTEGKWTWTDGSDMTYTNWDTNEPNGCCGTGDHGGIYVGSKWHDVRETVTINAVCKKCDDLTESPTTAPTLDPTAKPTAAPTSLEPTAPPTAAPTLEPTAADTGNLEGWVNSSLNICLEIIEEVDSFRDEENREPRRRTDEELNDKHLAARITGQLEVCSNIVGIVHSFQEGHLAGRLE